MAARVLSIRDLTPKQAQYSLLVSALPGRGIQTIGVLLLDPATDTLRIRLRRDWERLGDEEDVEVLAELEDDLAAQAEKQIKESADSLGIFVTAETNASLFINNFLQKEGFKNININFSQAKNRLQ